MILFVRLFNLAEIFDRFWFAAKTFLTINRCRIILLITPLCLFAAVLQAQTIQFTTLPGTDAVENVPYTGSIFATINNNDKLTYSAPVLPPWLTMESDGANARKVNNQYIPAPAGVTINANNNVYVVQHSSQNIYKITPDGNQTVWAQRPPGNSYGALIVDNYLYVSLHVVGGGIPGIYRFNLNSASPVAEEVILGTGFLSMTNKDGYLYAASFSSNKIVRINLSNFQATDYVNVPGCFGLGFDPAGNLIVASYTNKKIVRYNPTTSTLTDIITGFSHNPSDVKVDAMGNLYVSFYSAKIRKYTPDYASFVEVGDNGLTALSMSLSPTGVLMYGDVSTGYVYALQTGITLTGTPSHEDVGDHPVKIAATNGTVTKNHEFVIRVTDPNPPVIVSYSPVTLAQDVGKRPTLTAVFNETIKKGSGKVYIMDRQANRILHMVDVSLPEVAVSDKTLTISLLSDLPLDREIAIRMDDGVVKDVNNNNFAGILNTSTWYFKTDKVQETQTLSFAPTASVPYGAADVDPGAVASSGLAVSYSSSDESIATIVAGKVRVLKVGTVTITANQAGDDDYLPATPFSQVLTVTPKEITVSLVEDGSGTKMYNGDTDIDLGATAYQLTGLVGDDEVAVTGEAGFEDPNAGTGKTITATNFVLSGKDKDNYSLTTISATVSGTISAALLAITADPKNKTYGAADPVFTYQSAGLLSGDAITGALTRASGKDVGEYAILRGTLTAGDNYSLEFVPSVFTITPAALTIRAENKNRDAWQENPVFTFAYTGFAEDDNAAVLSTPPTAQTPASHSSPTGKYAIVVSGASSPNYNISYVNGELTVGEIDRREVKVWSSGSQLQIRIFTEVAQKSRIMLFSPSGQVLIAQQQQLQPGLNSFTIPVGYLASAIYVLHVNADRFKDSQQVRINK